MPNHENAFVQIGTGVIKRWAAQTTQHLCVIWCSAFHFLFNTHCFAEGRLTKRALYKMYEMTGSCRRWPRMIRLLMSSVTEPPLHSWEGNREKPMTPPSLTSLNYDSWGGLARPHKSERKGSLISQHDKNQCYSGKVALESVFLYYYNLNF